VDHGISAASIVTAVVAPQRTDQVQRRIDHPAAEAGRYLNGASGAEPRGRVPTLSHREALAGSGTSVLLRPGEQPGDGAYCAI
jgi:hypothetical protein